jgi:hypothetical protein
MIVYWCNKNAEPGILARPICGWTFLGLPWKVIVTYKLPVFIESTRSKIPPLNLILSYLSLFHQFTFCLSKTHLNNIFPYIARSPKCAFPLMFIESIVYTYFTHLILLNLIARTNYANVGFEFLTAVVMKCSVFWDIIFTPVSCFAYSSTLKMEATSCPETSVEFKRTTRRHVSEDRTLSV